MQKTVTTQGLKSGMGDIVDAVRLRGDRFVINRGGKAVAALVPIHAFRAMERCRERLIELMNEVASRNVDKGDRGIERVIVEEVRAVRKQRRRDAGKI